MFRFVETQNLASQGWRFGVATWSETQDFASLHALLRQNRPFLQGRKVDDHDGHTLKANHRLKAVDLRKEKPRNSCVSEAH